MDVDRDISAHEPIVFEIWIAEVRFPAGEEIFLFINKLMVHLASCPTSPKGKAVGS
jgi:hypothetical protein